MPWVFPNLEKGTRTSKNGRFRHLGGLIRRLCNIAHIKPFSWHTIRHPGAGVLAGKGMEAPQIQKKYATVMCLPLRFTKLIADCSAACRGERHLHQIGNSTEKAAEMLGEEFGNLQPIVTTSEKGSADGEGANG